MAIEDKVLTAGRYTDQQQIIGALKVAGHYSKNPIVVVKPRSKPAPVSLKVNL
jgi:hypothetical protein